MAMNLLSRINGIPKRFENCSFSNYKVSEENRRKFDICSNWKGDNSLILTGKPGTGKTHLAISALRNFPMVEVPEAEALAAKRRLEYESENGADEIKKKAGKYLKDELWKYRPARCLFTSFVEMFVHMNTKAKSDEGKESLLKKYSTNSEFDCICFDDLGTERMTDAKNENLYYIIDSRYREMLPTIITSNFTINQIAGSDQRIASRFSEMGLVLQFDGEDYRKKINHSEEKKHGN